MGSRQRVPIWLMLILLLAACGSPGSTSSTVSSQRSQAEPARSPIRITAAILANPPLLFRPFLTPASLGQTTDISDLMNVGLTNADDQNVRRPVFAEAVPSLDNGLWSVSDDGGMTLTWHIRPGSQ